MNLKRYYTAFNRYKRSKGFGIHSPFAFSFVLQVLRERCPYYAYDDISSRRKLALSLAADVARHPRIISLKNAKMLFRIVCYFNPRVMLQIGTSYGVSTTAMLDVDSRSKLVIYTGDNPHRDIYDKVTADYKERIREAATANEAIAHYRAVSQGDGVKFMVVNSVDSDMTRESVLRYAGEVLDGEGVVAMRNLSRDERMATLFNDLDSSHTHGMTFTNGRIAVIVGYRHLPRQSFSLWF